MDGAEETPAAFTEAVMSYTLPASTVTGALVHVGEPDVAAFPPLLCSCAACEPSVPPVELDDAVPAPVLWPDHAAGCPAAVCCSKSPFVTLLPWTVTASVDALFVSLHSSTAPARSAVTRIVRVPFVLRVSQSTETVAEPPAGIEPVAAESRTRFSSTRKNSVCDPAVPASPMFLTVAVTVTFSPSRTDLLVDVVMLETTRSGLTSAGTTQALVPAAMSAAVAWPTRVAGATRPVAPADGGGAGPVRGSGSVGVASPSGIWNPDGVDTESYYTVNPA